MKPLNTSDLFAIRSVEPSRYVLEGELSFKSVEPALKKTAKFFNFQGKTIFDLSRINKADSAGLALLLEWLRIASLVGIELHYVNLPRQLLAMAQVAGVDDILVIDKN